MDDVGVATGLTGLALGLTVADGKALVVVSDLGGFTVGIGLLLVQRRPSLSHLLELHLFLPIGLGVGVVVRVVTGVVVPGQTLDQQGRPEVKGERGLSFEECCLEPIDFIPLGKSLRVVFHEDSGGLGEEASGFLRAE